MTQHDMQDYLFDLRGYLILENAIDAQLLADLNAAFDAFPDLAFKDTPQEQGFLGE